MSRKGKVDFRLSKLVTNLNNKWSAFVNSLSVNLGVDNLLNETCCFFLEIGRGACSH